MQVSAVLGFLFQKGGFTREALNQLIHWFLSTMNSRLIKRKSFLVKLVYPLDCLESPFLNRFLGYPF
jgi:hypothetical protein